MVNKTPQVLDWARSLQAIAQSGEAYDPGPYDRERYEQVRRIAAEMLASDGDVNAVEADMAAEVGHATPKLDVRGVVFRDDAILLVRESYDNLWNLPGGWVDVGESPSEAVVREVREETGYATRAVKLLALYDRDRHASTPHRWHIWKACFLCEIVGASQSEPDAEISEVRFFKASDLPNLDNVRMAPDYVERFFAHHGNPQWPTDFD